MATGGVTSTVLKALVDPQINISSVGDTYTDTAGNTYAETTNQTRMTTNAVYKRYVVFKGSGLVGANTGTIQLWNFTQSGEIANKTTTATSETTIAMTTAAAVTALADVITLRVKNSNAGGTFQILAGGMLEADSILEITATGSSNVPVFGNLSWLNSWKVIIIKGISTATITLQPYTTLTNGLITYNIGSAISTLNSVQTITINNKFYNSQNAACKYNTSAIAGQAAIASAFGISADNI
jgi:hypothetical protein